MTRKDGEYRSACRGCHGGCVHILTIKDGRLVGLRPDPDAPLSMGHACAKGVSIIEQMYHPDRLLHPMRRIGERGSGKWERIGWDEALDTIAHRLGALKARHGSACIATITGTGRHLVPYLTRFAHAIGTPNAASAGAIICLGPRKNGGYSTSGVYNCVDYYGDTKPGLIVVWGANPTISGADGELQWHPQRVAQTGTKFIVIDPKKTELAEHAELWLRLRPGTDGALALGILNYIISEGLYDHDFVENWCYGFEELRERCAEYDLDRVSRITWLPKEQIIAAARMMASVKPMGIEWGCAFEQGFNAMQTCRAIYMIPALTGNYDIPGGWVEGKQISSIKRDPINPDPKLINYFPYRSLRQCADPHQVLDAIRMGRPHKIRAMLSFANNCLLSLPDSKRVKECLEELEFFVCMDVFMTPTAELADIVLPAALWPELDAVFTMPEFSEHSILCQQKLVQVGEARPDEDVFVELAHRMGVDYGAPSQRELIDMEIESMGSRIPELQGLSFDYLKEHGWYTPKRSYYNYKTRGGFNTPTGKFELWSKEVEYLGGDPLPYWQEPPVTPVSRPDLHRQFPYILTTGGRSMQYFISNNRQIRSLRRQYPFPLVRMHPDTARENGIEEGDWVYIRTFRGRITQKCKFEPDMDPRVVNCDFGWWYPEAGAPDYGWAESNANVLTSCDDGCDPYLGSYQLRSVLCNIYKNEDCSIEERYYNSALYFEPETDKSSPCVEIDRSRCLLCGECVRVCRGTQGVGALSIGLTEGLTRLNVERSKCVGCGQCAAVCKAGAMGIKTDADRVLEALSDENTIVLAQVAPSVRVGLGGQLGFPKGMNTMDKVVGALRAMGFDRVYDTVFGADLTVAEESAEFLARLESGEKLPLFTSCCPAWLSFCEKKFPALAGNISSCRSPQQMLGAVMRRWWGEKENPDGKRIVSVSIMPCTAKKAEILRPDSCSSGVQDIDYSVTTGELLEMMKKRGISAENCPESSADAPFALGSGGGSLFGTGGGVTEAVLRYLGIGSIEWTEAEGIRSASFRHGGREIRIATVSGLGNAESILRRIEQGERFELVEVMACPGGCVMGGGQPANVYEVLRDRAHRSKGLRKTDEASPIRAAQDNAAMEHIRRTLIAGHEHELLHRK